MEEDYLPPELHSQIFSYITNIDDILSALKNKGLRSSVINFVNVLHSDYPRIIDISILSTLSNVVKIKGKILLRSTHKSLVKYMRSMKNKEMSFSTTSKLEELEIIDLLKEYYKNNLSGKIVIGIPVGTIYDSSKFNVQHRIVIIDGNHVWYSISNSFSPQEVESLMDYLTSNHKVIIDFYGRRKHFTNILDISQDRANFYNGDLCIVGESTLSNLTKLSLQDIDYGVLSIASYSGFQSGMFGRRIIYILLVYIFKKVVDLDNKSVNEVYLDELKQFALCLYPKITEDDVDHVIDKILSLDGNRKEITLYTLSLLKEYFIEIFNNNLRGLVSGYTLIDVVTPKLPIAKDFEYYQLHDVYQGVTSMIFMPRISMKQI